MTQQIGTVKLVQVQRNHMKQGDGPARHYDPAGLVVVERLLLEAEGVVGLTADGTRILDAHHANRPDTRNQGGENGISLGFTTHYGRIRERYGSHIRDGVAAENIIVETDRDFVEGDPGAVLGIESATSGEIAHLVKIFPAPPCVEFSCFVITGKVGPMLGDQRPPAEQIKTTLQFLDNGMRGFYATMQQPGTVVQAGDRVIRL